MNNPQSMHPSLPWWRVPMVWMVVALPALVVVASFATLFVAVRGGDAPLHEASATQPETYAPATQARNHAAAPRR